MIGNDHLLSRIITDCITQDAQRDVYDFLDALPGVSEIHMKPIQPYWKNPEQGELSVSFVSSLSMEEIQAMLANRWESDTADARRAGSMCPMLYFCGCLHDNL